MPIYVTLARYTGAIEGGGPERFAEVQKIAAAEGGKLTHVYGFLGPYDIMAVGEFADTRAAMKMAAKVGNLIGARTVTMPAVARDGFLQLLTEL